MAEDGRIYEESAIEEYFNTNSGSTTVKSPYAGLQIGKRLIAAPQIKCHIESLIENVVITGDLADKWKEQEKLKKDTEDLLKKAEGGDLEAILNVGFNYEWGKDGFKKDEKLAYGFYEKGRAAGSVTGMVKVGHMLAVGYGVSPDKLKAMMYLTRAEAQGSDAAAYALGVILADGRCGFPVDKVEAHILLKKYLSGNCPHKHLSGEAEAKAQAQAILDRLMNEST